MNKNIFLLPLVLLAALFTSCEETKEVGKYDNWQARNEAFIDSLQAVYDAKTNPKLEYLVPMNNLNVKIFYEKIIAKETGTSPLFTETVAAYYRGSYIFGEVFDENFSGIEPNLDFDSPLKGTVQLFYTGGSARAVSGWADILQKMKVGERWLTYIPWQVAYGASGSEDGSILGYTTLIFDMQLLKIVEE